MTGDRSAGAPADPVPATTETPSWFARMKEKNGVLRQALERLSDDHRQVIVSRNLDLLSFVEIGREMDRSPDAVRKLWLRALEALRRELGDFDEG